MQRTFNRKQKEALYIMANGSCQNCGRQLPDDWHADHIKPYDKGGKTDVLNGQALCPACNLKKGAKMNEFPYQLRQWQEQLYEQYFGDWLKDYLVVATPGSGKTIAALYIVHQLIADRTIDRVIIATHTDYLRDQWIEEANKCGISLTTMGINHFGDVVITEDFDGLVVTYAQIANNKELFRKLCQRLHVMTIADEVHHLADDLTWGASYKVAFWFATKRIALSGTPFRSDNNTIPFVKYDPIENGDQKSRSNFYYGYGHALSDGKVVRPIVFPTWDGKLVWMKGWDFKEATFGDDLNDEDGREALRTAVYPKGQWLKDVIKSADNQLNHVRSNGDLLAGGLLVATDTLHAEEIAKLLQNITGEYPDIATSKVEDAKGVIEGFKNSDKKWIVAVRMISEGVDIKRLRIGVYATTTATRTFFYQVIGRVIRWRADLKDKQTAYFYFPMYAPIVRYMKEIQDEIEDVVRFQNGDFKIERSSSGAIEASLYRFVESEATREEHIYQDLEFTKEELDEARRLYGNLPVMRGASDAEMAYMVRAARAEKPGRAIKTERPSTNGNLSKHKQKESLSQQVKTYVGMLAGELVRHGLYSQIGEAIKAVHNAWGKENGYHKEMTLEQYEEKIAWCGQIITDIKSERYDEWNRIASR